MDSQPPSKKPSDVPVPKLKPKRKRRPPAVPWKKPKDMPRRPLSAYNLFFRRERERMLKAGWKSAAKAAKEREQVDAEDEEADSSASGDKSKTGGFANLARTVAAKWKTLPADEKAPFEEEAAREKARYDSQMLRWRAVQEQKKAQKAGPPRHIIDQLTSGAALQAYAAHLEASQGEMEYPDTWFQASDPQRPDNTDATLHMLGLKEQQERILLMQQQQQLQQSVSELPMSSADTNRAFGASGFQHADHLAQQQQVVPEETIQIEEDLVDKKLPAKLPAKPSPWSSGNPSRPPPFSPAIAHPGALSELRAEASPIIMRRPFMMEQIAGGGANTVAGLVRHPQMEQRGFSLGDMAAGYQSQFHALGEESSITAGMLQQSFFGASGGLQPQQQPFTFGGEEPQQRIARVVEQKRASMGMPPGYHPPHRGFELSQRMVRSQSFPSSLSLSPKVPSPEDNRGKLAHNLDHRVPAAPETPLTPLQSPPLHMSPHSTAHSIMNSPTMVPTPPQQGGSSLMQTNSPREGMEMPRPLSAPPPNFPSDDEFQSIDTPRLGNRRLTQAFQFHQEQQEQQQQPANNLNEEEVGDIRLCEEMAAEMGGDPTSNQSGQQNTNLFQSTFEALDSDDAVDFLSNLKFEGA